MGFFGGRFGYWSLRFLAPDPAPRLAGDVYDDQSKLQLLLGDRIYDEIQGAVVADFGCGVGTEAIEMGLAGAARVIGLDIREEVLQMGRKRAVRSGVGETVMFTTSLDERVDLIICLDSFEHFEDVDGVLQTMYSGLKPGGRVLISFGPPWFHPLGGHFFSAFPWAHLIFTESALIRWRSDFKDDGATRFSEVEGGLNQMTIARFEEHVSRSNFVLEKLNTVPIRKLRFFANKFTREFTTSIVRATLLHPSND